jgi:hypothetical protein
MKSNKKRHLVEQVWQFRARFAQSVGRILGDVAPAALLMQWVAEEAGRWRERIYSPLATLVLFIEQVLEADQSCQKAVSNHLSDRAVAGQAPCSPNTGPYCKARARLARGLIERVGRETGARVCAQQPRAWLWRGREVILVDGTTVSMPDTAANQAVFPQNHAQKVGLGFPLARLVAIISLSCGVVLEWAVAACEGKQTGETALLWPLAGRLKPGDVVVADRCYSTYFMMAWLARMGVDGVMRQHQRRHTDFRCGQRLGVRDHLVDWERPRRPAWMDEATFDLIPTTLTLRETRVGGGILVTTLRDARTVSKQDLLQLYRWRWHVELDLRSIKDVMQMDVLRCKTPDMVKKEIAVHLLAYNLVRAVMAQAACLGQVSPRTLSFKAVLQLLNSFAKGLSLCPRDRLVRRQAQMLASMAKRRLPHRPGRVEPRAVKRRPKPRALLTQPRKVLRKHLLKQQKHIDAGLR